MPNNTNFLIIESQPVMVDFYIKGINKVFLDNSITVVTDIESFKNKIETKQFDFVITVCKLTEINSAGILFGYEISQLVLDTNSNSKIVISTDIKNNNRILNIIESVNPIAIILKNELTEKSFFKLLKKVKNNDCFYSETVQRLLNQKVNFISTSNLENRHYKLLVYLKQGYTNKQLESVLKVSNKTILNWKNQIAEVLDTSIKNILIEAVKRELI